METSYEVMWTSGECPGGVLSGNKTIAGTSISHIITGLRGGTTYTITVNATTSAGTNSVTGDTKERGG